MLIARDSCAVIYIPPNQIYAIGGKYGFDSVEKYVMD